MNKEHKNILLLIIRGQTTNFGNIIFDYANKLLIANLASRSSFFMMIYQSTESVIQLIFNLFAGYVADFSDRKRMLIITDLIAAIATFFLFLFYSPQNIWALIVVNILLAILFSFNGPAYKAIIKDLLSSDGILTYNSFSKIVAEIVSVGAPLASVFVIHQFGFKYGMLINSLSFLVSALCEYHFHIQYQHENIQSKFFSGIKEGFLYLYKDKTLLTILITASFLNFLDAIYAFYLPFTSSFSDFHNIFAYILVAQSIGSIIGALIISLVKKKIELKHFLHFLLPGAISLMLINSLKFSQVIILILFAIFSTTVAMFNVNLMSHLQISIDSNFLGRIFSIIFTISGLFAPFGTLFASWIDIKSWQIFQLIGIGQLVIYLVSLLFINLNSEKS